MESFEQKLAELEDEECELEEKIGDNQKCLKGMAKEGRKLKHDLEEMEEFMKEVEGSDLDAQEVG